MCRFKVRYLLTPRAVGGVAPAAEVPASRADYGWVMGIPELMPRIGPDKGANINCALGQTQQLPLRNEQTNPLCDPFGCGFSNLSVTSGFH
jgi:hypothetical protein